MENYWKIVTQGTRFVNETTKRFKLWILEDAEKEEWSEDTSILSTLYRNVFGNNYLDDPDISCCQRLTALQSF